MTDLKPLRFYFSIRVKAILLVVSIPVLFMSAMLYKNHELNRIEFEELLLERSEVQAELLAHTVGQAMWDLNTRYLKSAIGQAIKAPDLEKIIIRDDMGKIIESIWTPEWTGTHSVITHPVDYNFAGENKRLGQVELYVSHSNIDALVQKRTQFWLVLVVVALLAQMTIFYIILTWLLNPIGAITKTMLRLSRGETGITIPFQHRRDEIGQMATAIETFRHTAVRASELTLEIEERNRLQAELETARQQAENANQAKSQFLATMSHEIRTPLNGVLATAELLSDTELNARQKKYISIIRNSGELLLSLLNDILDLAKIEAGKLEVHPEISNIRQAFEDTCNLFVAQAHNKHLKFTFTISEDVPKHALLDIFRLRQVMANLVSNAIKYTERGHVDVSLITDMSRPFPVLVFSVKDSGRGIPKESLALVFDKFTQIHRTASIGGTGLGLPICQSLIELMGGKLAVSSEVGEGSVFHFWIPLVPVSAADAETVAQLEVQENSHVGCKVLLAEDVETNQLIITEMLQNLGCDVKVAENGQIAVEKACFNAFDIIFMDCNMPVMDGYSASRRLRELGQIDIPIIAVTAHALADEKQKCIAAGMTDFISKPLRKRDLARMLDLWAKGSIAQHDPALNAAAAPASIDAEFDSSIIDAWLNGPSPERALRMIELTLKDSARLAGEIENASLSGDCVALSESAHALKSVSAQVGALGLSAICRDMEQDGKTQDLSRNQENLARFKSAYEQAVWQICTMRERAKPASL